MWKFLEFVQKYFMKGMIIFSVLIILWGGWFKYIHKGNFDDIFREPQGVAYLTPLSATCIASSCHGTGETKTVEVSTPWGKQTWQGKQYTYIDPHTKIKEFKFTPKKKVKFHVVSEAFAGQYNGYGNHPVGIPYPISDSEYRPYGALPSVILLPNGYVECESCHLWIGEPDPNSSNPHVTLVMSNSQSALCLSCHLK